VNRICMTSLEGVWRTTVRAAELATPMLLSSRDCPLVTVAYGPLMARRSWGTSTPGHLACGTSAVHLLPLIIPLLLARLSAPITRFRLLGVKARLDGGNFCVT
jgi:hypothetical protein